MKSIKENKRYHVTPSKAFRTLAHDARWLLAATEDAAEEKVVRAREQLAATLDLGKSKLAKAGEQAFARARAADIVVHKYPYPVVCLALGVGSLLGMLFARRNV